MYKPDLDISVLVGQTLTDVRNDGDEIIFLTDLGKSYVMFHDQDCCESVSVDDINGDLNDLIGSPITLAEESVSHDADEVKDDVERYGDDSCTWTFYRLATVKGYVNIRWFGSSNGYYSESVSFRER